MRPHQPYYDKHPAPEPPGLDSRSYSPSNNRQERKNTDSADNTLRCQQCNVLWRAPNFRRLIVLQGSRICRVLWIVICCVWSIVRIENHHETGLEVSAWSTPGFDVSAFGGYVLEKIGVKYTSFAELSRGVGYEGTHWVVGAKLH